MGYLDDLGGLAGKQAAIVGGGIGVGRGLTLALARAGVELAVLDNDAEGLEETAGEIRGLGGRIATFVADATVPAELGGFFDLVEREFGGLDILVNVVGGVRQRMFMETTSEDWQGDIHRNYGYTLQSTQRAVTLMQRKGNGGSIINFTTIEAHRGAASYAVYAGAKAALTNFSRALAVELGPIGIRVNTLAPDTTPSAGILKSRSAATNAQNAAVTPEQRAAALAIYVPMGQPPTIEELAKGVLFLASDLSSAVTGTTLHVDGGAAASFGFQNWPYEAGYGPVARGKALLNMFPQDDPSWRRD